MPTGSTLLLGAALTLVPEVPPPPAEPVVAPSSVARLEWHASPPCPDAERGASLLAQFMGGRALSAPARVELVADATGHVATVAVDGATRTLQATDCETLARAAALVVAVSLEPVVTAAIVVPPGAAEARPLAEAVAPTEVASPTEPRAQPFVVSRPAAPGTALRRANAASRRPSRAPARASHWLGAGGGVALALAPVATGVARVGYAFEREVLQVRVEATYAAPRAVTYLSEPTVGGRFQSVVVGVQACFAPAAGRMQAPLCGGLEGGPLVGRGLGVDQARRPVGAWVGARVSAGLRARIRPRVAFVVGADLVVGLRRPAFRSDARETLFRATPVGLRGLFGVELRLR